MTPFSLAILLATGKKAHGVLIFTRKVGGKHGASDSKSTLDTGIAQRTSAAPEGLKWLEVNPNLTLGIPASRSWPLLHSQ